MEMTTAFGAPMAFSLKALLREQSATVGSLPPAQPLLRIPLASRSSLPNAAKTTKASTYSSSFTSVTPFISPSMTASRSNIPAHTPLFWTVLSTLLSPLDLQSTAHGGSLSWRRLTPSTRTLTIPSSVVRGANPSAP